MPGRLCAACGRRKTIRGVWYLTPTPAQGTLFVCETCFRGTSSPAAALTG